MHETSHGPAERDLPYQLHIRFFIMTTIITAITTAITTTITTNPDSALPGSCCRLSTEVFNIEASGAAIRFGSGQSLPGWTQPTLEANRFLMVSLRRTVEGYRPYG